MNFMLLVKPGATDWVRVVAKEYEGVLSSRIYRLKEYCTLIVAVQV